MLFIVCGVSGSGKTTIGKLLSEALEIPFYDADDFHPASNVEKMKSGLPLSDEDRQPWLDVLAGNLREWQEAGDAVLACAALKESHRSTLGAQCGESIRWVVLHATEEVLAERLTSRKGHFFDPQLLHSQLETFEMPDYGWQIDVDASPREIVNTILERLSDK